MSGWLASHASCASLKSRFHSVTEKPREEKRKKSKKSFDEIQSKIAFRFVDIWSGGRGCKLVFDFCGESALPELKIKFGRGGVTWRSKSIHFRMESSAGFALYSLKRLRTPKEREFEGFGSAKQVDLCPKYACDLSPSLCGHKDRPICQYGFFDVFRSHMHPARGMESGGRVRTRIFPTSEHSPPLSCGQFELAPSAHILQICDPIAISYCGLVRRCDGRSGVVLYLHLYQDSVGHSEVSICHNDYKTSNPWGTGPGGLKCLSLYQRKDTVSF